MNNYYTLIYLNREIKRNILGGEFEFALSPHKDVLECYIAKENFERRIIFSANPREIVLFLDDYRAPKKHNVLEFFKPLYGSKITDVTLAHYDRLLSFRFDNQYRLLFKLFGHDANALLLKDDIITDAFKHPESMKNEPAPRPQVPDFNQKITDKAKPKNQLTKQNPLLPRNLLPPLIEQHKVAQMSVEEVKEFTQKITHALQHDPQPRVLTNGNLCLWSHDWLGLPTEESFNTVNEGIRFAYRNAVHLRRLHQKKERLVQFLDRLVKKKQAQLEQLRQADKSLRRADEYEKFGHLLMAHAHESVKSKKKSITVTDFYENDASLVIPLKGGNTIAENAEQYYQKAKASRRSYKKAKERLPEVEQEKKLTEALLGELQQIKRLPALDKWIKNHQKTLELWGYGTENEGQSESPFRKFKVGKYEVWIGKSAKSNDALTRRAHKEDIWLHARGVAGSHALIRMGNEKSFPPKNVILHAAAYAAWYSKAKGMKTAPVIFTKRKYIHKPKGAVPGAVVVERENVEMVPPTKPK